MAITLNLQVGAGNSDAWETQSDTGFDGTSTQMELHSNTVAGSRRIAGFRFTNVTIPPRSTIVTATLSLSVNIATQDDPNMDIFCEAADSSVDFVTDGDVFNRARTTATVTWIATGVGTGFKSPSNSLATLVQEVVDRAGWASGNALTVICRGKSDLNRLLLIDAYESGAANAAKLDITYNPPAGGPGNSGNAPGRGRGNPNPGGGGNGGGAISDPFRRVFVARRRRTR